MRALRKLKKFLKSTNKDVYKAVATSIDNTIKDKMHADFKPDFKAKRVTKDTLLSELMNKVIICMDKTVVRNYKDYTACSSGSKKCYDLQKYINIESGSEDLNLLKYSEVMDQCVIPININDDNVTTTVKTLKYVTSLASEPALTLRVPSLRQPAHQLML
jgi:hypothetical protein